MTACLTEPTSVTVAPGFRCGAIVAATSPMAPTGTASTTRSAPATALSALSSIRSHNPISRAVLRVASLRAWPTISPANPAFRIAWAIEPAISPRPIRATRS